MQTPDDSRSSKPDKCVFGPCENPVIRGTQSCSPKHSISLGNNARQTKLRLSRALARIAPIEDHRDYLPNSPRERDYAISELLAPIGQRLAQEGPYDREFRCSSRERLEAMRSCLLSEERRKDRLSLLAQCTLNLIDLGVELEPGKTPLADDILKLLQYGKELNQIFSELGDPVNVARSAILTGNVFRLLEDEHSAGRMMRYATHVLRGLPNLYQDKHALEVLQVGTLYIVRFWQYTDRKELARDALRIAELAMKVGGIKRRLEACRSLAGYYIAEGKTDAASKAIEELKKVQKAGKFPLYGDWTLLRPLIELFLLLGDFDAARKLILQCIELNNLTHDGYQRKILEKWMAIGKLELQQKKLVEAEFSSPLLTYLTRYESPEWIAAS